MDKRNEAVKTAAKALTDLNKWALIEEIIEGMYASLISASNATKVLLIAKNERIKLLRLYDKSLLTAAKPPLQESKDE